MMNKHMLYHLMVGQYGVIVRRLQRQRGCDLLEPKVYFESERNIISSVEDEMDVMTLDLVSRTSRQQPPLRVRTWSYSVAEPSVVGAESQCKVWHKL